MSTAQLVYGVRAPAYSPQFGRNFDANAWTTLGTYQTATGVAVSGACILAGIECTASSSGVITVYDNTAGSGKQLRTSLALTANAFHAIANGGGLLCTTGVYITLVSGTATFSPVYIPAL